MGKKGSKDADDGNKRPPDVHQIHDKRKRLDAIGGIAKAFAKKVVAHQARKQVNDKRVFGMHTITQIRKYDHHDEQHCQRFEYGPRKPEVVARIFYFKIPQGEVEKQAAVFKDSTNEVDDILQIAIML